MGTKFDPRRMSQWVQPLQASAPCTCVPTLWIEPDSFLDALESSIRTLAAMRWVCS